MVNRPGTFGRGLLLRWGMAWLFALALAGCEASDSSTVSNATTPSSRNFDQVAIGDITGASAELQKRSVYLRRQLSITLREEGDFVRVHNPAPDPLPPGTLLVAGELIALSEGDKDWRFVIGFGLGAASATGSFRLSDSNGASLAAFEKSSTYDGKGMDEAAELDVNSLVKALGRDTALAVIRWSKGGSLSEQ